MKKTLLILLSSFSLLSSGYAQSFTTQKDTISATITGNPNQEIHNNITASGSAVYITWKVTSTNFPASWTDSASLGVCDATVCIQNSGAQITNGTPHSGIAPYAAGVAGDFHLLMNLSNTAATGAYTMVINMQARTAPGTTGAVVAEKNVVFVVGKYPTSVKTTVKADDAVSIFPNPAKSVLNVNYTGAASVKSIAVFNVIGKNVQTTKVSSNNNTLDVDNLPSGLYYVRIMDASGSILATRRFTHQ